MVTNNDDVDDDCYSNVHDCAGTCDGNAVVDDCGVCDGGNADQDCAGECGGSAVEDECGTCDSDTSNDCAQDCLGAWGGDAIEDACGICNGDGSSCADCAGVPNGDSYEDECNVCDNDPSNDCAQDCSGEWGGDAVMADFYYDLDGDGQGAGSAINLCSAFAPDGMVTNNDDEDDDCYSNVHDCAGTCDGNAVVDDCGVCDGGNADQDCAGECGGSAVEDECGTCDSDTSNDCAQDCTGAWGGSSEVDECGVCGGDNSTCLDCAGNANGSAYEDECGTCDDDTSNDCQQDCAGVWGGTTQPEDCTVTDIDGNIYQNVQIGDQLWMAENLKVIHYKNGDEIPTGYSNSEWANLSTGAYAVYNDDPSNTDVYGNLYNWYAVETGNLAPEGWHVPTDDEIKELEMYLGMSQRKANNTGFGRSTNEGSKLAGRADLWYANGNLENNPEFGTIGLPALISQINKG